MCMGPYERIPRNPRKPALPVKVHMSTGHPFEVCIASFDSFYQLMSHLDLILIPDDNFTLC